MSTKTQPDLTAVAAERLYAMERAAGWEPAKIRADIDALDTNPDFANLPADLLATIKSSALDSAARIEAEGAAAAAEIARRRLASPRWFGYVA